MGRLRGVLLKYKYID